MKKWIIERLGFWLSMVVHFICLGITSANSAVMKDEALVPTTIPWSGFYIGVNAGTAWGQAKTTLESTLNLVNTKSVSTTSTGGILGGQLGYNWQLPTYKRIFIGVETDINWITLKGAPNNQNINDKDGSIYFNAFSSQQKSSYLGTLRPRIGFLLVDYLVIYGTGGVAYGNEKCVANGDTRTTDEPESTQYPVNSSVVEAGWTAGGGAELAFSPHWSAKLEYLYYNLDNVSSVGNPIPDDLDSVHYTWSNPTQLIRLGINYKFP